MEPSILVAYVKDKLDEIQSSLLERAKSFRDRQVLLLSHFFFCVNSSERFSK